jgi:hypothetical protein
MTAVRAWAGRAVTAARARVGATLPRPCGHCGQPVQPSDAWVIGHKIPRTIRPDLTWEPSNWRPEHRRCSNASAPRVVSAKYRAMREDNARMRNQLAIGGQFFGDPIAQESRATSRDTPPTLLNFPRFDPTTIESVPWLADLLDIPSEASWPLAMTPPHPAAVGSYGAEAEAWIRDELGVSLRWWQRLATRRQLEHDRDGVLVWQTILESTPRRAGKSVRLRGMALWRIDHAWLFGEEQLALHTGKDLPICKEIHRRAWRWAEARGWTVRRQNGNEEIETREGSRWVVRGSGSVYGYDVTLGMIDEAWGVAPDVVDEGIEPAMLERSMPQLLLTSTAHRRATPLMRRRFVSALAGMGDDLGTLLLWWGAEAGTDLGDEDAWRAASPHWTAQRRNMIAAKLERAMRGEADPDTDDPDPLEGFRCQYLNVWPSALAPRRAQPVPLLDAADWQALATFTPDGRPDAVGVEAWFGSGVAVVAAWALGDGRVGVSSAAFDSVALAGAWALAWDAAVMLAGKSIAADPALVGCAPVGATSRASVADLRRLLDGAALTHDGSPALSDQVLAVRTVPGAEGVRLVSQSRMDAMKAAVWAAGAARSAVETPAIW